MKKFFFSIFILFVSIFSFFLCAYATWTTNSSDDFSSTWFTITTNDIMWWVWQSAKWWSTWTSKFNIIFWEIIDNMMIAIWVIAMVIMSIWAWYMIIYNWQEELLTKWRKIFFSWILALLIALSSYYIINLIRYILYH